MSHALHTSRRRRYIDRRLQRRLLLAVLALETLLWLAAMAWVQQRLGERLEVETYRVHLDARTSLLAALWEAAWPALAVMVGTHALLLAALEMHWLLHLRRVLRPLDEILRDMADLRLDREIDAADGTPHPALQAAQAWCRTERLRHQTLQGAMADVEGAPGEMARKRALEVLLKALPEAASRNPPDKPWTGVGANEGS